MPFFPADGPAVQDLIAVSTTQVEVKVGATAYAERKIITIQPQDGKVRVLFESGLAANHGIEVGKKQLVTFEASASQPIYLITEIGTTNVIIVERA